VPSGMLPASRFCRCIATFSKLNPGFNLTFCFFFISCGAFGPALYTMMTEPTSFKPGFAAAAAAASASAAAVAAVATVATADGADGADDGAAAEPAAAVGGDVASAANIVEVGCGWADGEEGVVVGAAAPALLGAGVAAAAAAAAAAPSPPESAIIWVGVYLLEQVSHKQRWATLALKQRERKIIL